MPLVEISEADLDFLKNLAHEIKTQGCASTASPYFFVVETEREIIVPAGHTGDRVYVDTRDSEAGIMRSEAEVKAYARDRDIPDDEVEARIEEYDVATVEERHNVFFTRKAYDKHMELNGHNYRGISMRNAHPYICYAGRNPEIKTLLEIVDRLGSCLTN